MLSHMVLALLALSATSIALGGRSPFAVPLPYPLEDISAKFFSELQVLRFIPLCATTMAVSL